jgi:tetratricopeptide (TPR) repeat protein
MTDLVSEHDFDAIDRYLCNDMTEEERNAFEQRLRNDGRLQEAVGEFDILIQGVEMAVLKEKMNSFHTQIVNRETHNPVPGDMVVRSNHDQNHAPVRQSDPSAAAKTSPTSGKTSQNIRHLTGGSFVRYLVAASFLLLLAMSAWWFATQRPAHTKLFAAYFTPDPGLITPMSADADYMFYEAMVDYKLHDYDKAIPKWESLLPHKPDNDTLNYFIGVAELARGNADTAIPYLQFVSTQKESIFGDDAFFYLGMAHLKLGHLTEAAESLENTSNQRGISVLRALKKRQSM